MLEDAEIEAERCYVEVLLSKKIIKKEGEFIRIKFLDEQMDNILKTSEKRRDAANKRWGKSDASDMQDNASALQNDADKKREREELEKRKNDFDRFWSKYPKRVEKKKTREKFMRLSIKEIDLIFATLDNFIAYKPFPEYTHPNATTYINNKRWEDEIPTKDQVTRPLIDKLVANVALQVPHEMQDLINKGWTEKEIIEISKG
jgi:hypothetical protein